MENNLIIANQAVSEIINTIKNLPVIKQEDALFLKENSAHLAQVCHKTYMWRTNIQKKSIINDIQFPTIHSKFHQSILEQKVQFEQAMYLAKDFEMKKLEIEELECDLEELTDSKRDQIIRRKKEIEIQFKQFELKQMQIAMEYRMMEIKGWKEIQNELLNNMKENGLDEQTIWNKEEGEVTSIFFQSLNNLQGIKTTTDSGEYNNLISLAVFAVKQAKEMGIYDKLYAKCNDIQRGALNLLKNLSGF